MSLGPVPRPRDPRDPQRGWPTLTINQCCQRTRTTVGAWRNPGPGPRAAMAGTHWTEEAVRLCPAAPRLPQVLVGLGYNVSRAFAPPPLAHRRRPVHGHLRD